MIASNISLLKGAAIIGSVIFGIIVHNEYNNAQIESIEEAREDVVMHRSDEDKSVFERLSFLKSKANDICKKESLENDELEEAIKDRLKAAMSKCQYIFSRENAAFNRERKEISDIFDANKAIKEAVLKREKEALKRKLSSDSKYMAFESAKRAYKTSGLSVEDFDAKMAERKKEILESIIETRSSSEREAFENVDRLKSQLDIFDKTRRKSLKDERTEDEIKLIHEYDSIKGELADRSSRMKTIRSKRTDDEKKIFSDLSEANSMAEEILRRESEGINKTKSFARYLAKRKVSKYLVFVVGSLPVIPFVYFGYKYFGWLLNFIKMMEA